MLKNDDCKKKKLICFFVVLLIAFPFAQRTLHTTTGNRAAGRQTLPHHTMSWPHRRESVLFFAAAVLSQGLPVGCTPDAFPYTVVATPGDGNTTKEGNASNVAYTYSGSGFVPQGQFRSGYAQQCASGVTDTFVFCVGETESDVYSLTVYDTAVSALVVLVHDAPRYFDVGAGSGGEVFIAHHPGMLFVGVGTALFVVDVASPEDPTRMSASHFAVAQIVGVKCSGTHGGVHIAVHVV